jgi:hypothetical protein
MSTASAVAVMAQKTVQPANSPDPAQRMTSARRRPGDPD